MNLDAVNSVIYSRALTIAHTLVVNTDDVSGNLMEITATDGKTSHKIPIP